MVNLSHKTHNEMLQELSDKTVSILFDGCHHWSNEYQGIILFTKARLYFYELMHTDDSKAKTNADVISSKVKSLKDKSIKVISACCDNCKTSIKALNFDSNSAQEEIESNFIRQPCSAHTANLEIKDLFSKKKKKKKNIILLKKLAFKLYSQC